MWKWILRILAALLAALVVVAILNRDALMRLGAVNTLFDADRIVHNFSNMDALFETTPIPVQGRAAPLPDGAPMALPDDWEAWLDRRGVTGIVVLKDGAVVHETYRLGTARNDLRISWSLAKSYLSALFGIVLARGDIDDIDDPVTRYVPALTGSAYDGVTIRHVLQMSTGVEFDEDILDFWSDINKMGRIIALGGSMDAFTGRLDARDAAPGERWKYVSIDTHVLAMVLRAATGRSLPDLMADHVLTPLGTIRDPYYLTDGYGVAFALAGLNLTTRDYARMGEMFRMGGAFQGRRIVPEAWVEESTRPSAKTEAGKLRYGYQWWMSADPREGEFMARGVYGQYVYIDRASGVVIAVNAADLNFREDGAYRDSEDMFRGIAARLGESTE